MARHPYAKNIPILLWVCITVLNCDEKSKRCGKEASLRLPMAGILPDTIKKHEKPVLFYAQLHLGTSLRYTEKKEGEIGMGLGVRHFVNTKYIVLVSP